MDRPKKLTQYDYRTGKVVSASPLLTDKIDSSKIPALDKLEKGHSVRTMVTHQVTPRAIIGSISKKLKEDIKKKVKNQKPTLSRRRRQPLSRP